MDRANAKHRANVKVVVADSDNYTSQGLRNALTNEGYRDVLVVGRLAILRDLMMASMVDLLVLDADLRDGDAIGSSRRFAAATRDATRSCRSSS